MRDRVPAAACSGRKYRLLLTRNCGARRAASSRSLARTHSCVLRGTRGQGPSCQSRVASRGAPAQPARRCRSPAVAVFPSGNQGTRRGSRGENARLLSVRQSGRRVSASHSPCTELGRWMLCLPNLSALHSAQRGCARTPPPCSYHCTSAGQAECSSHANGTKRLPRKPGNTRECYVQAIRTRVPYVPYVCIPHMVRLCAGGLGFQTLLRRGVGAGRGEIPAPAS
jgi:hypothetical protein